MKRLSSVFRVFVFILTLFLEVSVHATEIDVHTREVEKANLARIQQEPPDCLNSNLPCAVENVGATGFEFHVGTSLMTLDQNTSVLRLSDQKIHIIKGIVWIHRASDQLNVSSEFGAVTQAGDRKPTGEYWVLKTRDQMMALAVSADIEIRPRGSDEKLLVSEGLQNYLGPVGFNGRASAGIPMPIPFKDQVMRWGRLYRGPKRDFEVEVERFHAKWRAASWLAAGIHQALYDRKVASVNEVKSAELAKAQKSNAENEAYRAMFRRRLLEGR